jgi:spore germination cell wall hydrolase CwlJ-like protein
MKYDPIEDVFEWLFLIVVIVLTLCACHRASADEPPALWKQVVGEAANQDYDGMYAVCCVVRNRTTTDMLPGLNAAKRRDLDRFVARQPLTVQQAAMTAVDIVAHGGADITHGALYFENIKQYGVPSWVRGKTVTVIIKDHVFYK